MRVSVTIGPTLGAEVESTSFPTTAATDAYRSVGPPIEAFARDAQIAGDGVP
jgi:hypothetical protein